MGILDSLREALGVAAETDATRAADPEDLFGLSTAYVTMEAELDYVPGGEAALCFSGVDSTSFAAARDEVDAVLDAGQDEEALPASTMPIRIAVLNRISL